MPTKLPVARETAKISTSKVTEYKNSTNNAPKNRATITATKTSQS